MCATFDSQLILPEYALCLVQCLAGTPVCFLEPASFWRRDNTHIRYPRRARLNEIGRDRGSARSLGRNLYKEEFTPRNRERQSPPPNHGQQLLRSGMSSMGCSELFHVLGMPTRTRVAYRGASCFCPVFWWGGGGCSLGTSLAHLIQVSCRCVRGCSPYEAWPWSLRCWWLL